MRQRGARHRRCARECRRASIVRETENCGIAVDAHQPPRDRLPVRGHGDPPAARPGHRRRARRAARSGRSGPLPVSAGEVDAALARKRAGGRASRGLSGAAPPASGICSPGSPIQPTTVPAVTVRPARRRPPAASPTTAASTSSVALSVSTSSSGSPSATCSPAALSQASEHELVARLTERAACERRWPRLDHQALDDADDGRRLRHHRVLEHRRGRRGDVARRRCA